MNGKPFTDAEIRTIKRMAPNHTASEIAKKLNRPASSIHNAITRRNLDISKNEYHQVKTSEIKLIAELSLQEMSASEMAVIANIPARRCNYIRAKYL